MVSGLGLPVVRHTDIGLAIGTCKLERGMEVSFNENDMAFLIIGSTSFRFVNLPC